VSFRGVRLILVPTDFSPASTEALSAALELAQTFGAAIELFHVDVDPSNAGAAAESIFPPRLLFESVIAETRRKLERAAAQARRAGVHCSTASEFGRSPQAIVEEARRKGAGLIVVGHRPRRGVRRMLWASVAEKVVRDAACPVVVVPASSYSSTARTTRRR
jgi:nucleotide-binding universal stress UspA family protein